MTETLYKVPNPMFGIAECYELQVKKLPVGKLFRYFVTERHGWWDGQTFHWNVETFNPQDGYATSYEAEERRHQQKLTRARSGFIHCFWIDMTRPDANGLVHEEILLD